MTRADKIRAVAQRAHDDGDCVCCLPDPDTVTNRCDCGEDTITGCGNRPDRHCGLNAEPDTITIPISRDDAEWWYKHYEPAAYPAGGPWEAIRRVDAAIRAALEGEQ